MSTHLGQALPQELLFTSQMPYLNLEGQRIRTPAFYMTNMAVLSECYRMRYLLILPRHGRVLYYDYAKLQANELTL